MGLIFFLSHGSFAKAEKDTAVSTPDPLGETEKVPAAGLKPDGKGPVLHEDVIEESSRPVPIASVAIPPFPERVGTRTQTAPAKEIKKEAGEFSATASESSPGEPKPSFLEATPEEMKQHWESLFSEEIIPGSVSYTVKAGDNLYVLAKRYQTTVDLIKKINGRTSDTIYPGMKLKIYTAPFSILVSKSANTLILYADGKPVRQYPVATGKDNSTPAGTFKIVNKLVDPTWFKTGAVLLPGDPENALGSRWMGFEKSDYGIHGTIEPESIGSQASQGCVRMLNADVEELYGLVPSGTQVTIQD